MRSMGIDPARRLVRDAQKTSPAKNLAEWTGFRGRN